MYILIKITGKQTEISVYQKCEDAVREMKLRYTKLIKEAEKIDWKRSWFDEENMVARVDDYRTVTEYRVGEIR